MINQFREQSGSLNTFLDFIFSVGLGRVPAAPAVEHFGNGRAVADIAMRVMTAPEFQAPRAVRWRREAVLSQAEIDFIVSHFDLAGDVDLSRLTKDEFCRQHLKPWLTGGYEQRGPTYVQAKSLPRSGHHMLAILLERYFQDELHYCERYKPAGCCHEIPCLKPFNAGARNRYMLQKSHDFELADAQDAGWRYVIQHRALVPRAQSNFELAIHNPHSRFKDNAKDFRAFCRYELDFTLRFYEKWLKADAPNKLVVTYEQLVGDTEAAVRQVVGFIEGDPADPARLARALAFKDRKVNTMNSPEGVRDPTSHRYFDRGFFHELESTLKGRFPDVAVAYHFV